MWTLMRLRPRPRVPSLLAELGQAVPCAPEGASRRSKSPGQPWVDLDYNWSAGQDNCNNEIDLEATATHEFGHFFGLGDITASSGRNLTMYQYSSVCRTKRRSLGKGDLIGLNVYW